MASGFDVLAGIMPRPLHIEFPGAIDRLMNRGERKETDEPLAERLAKERLSSTGWTEADLAARPKGDAGKLELARLLRCHTPMTRQWIADRLCIGSASYVSHLLSKERE